VGKPWLRLEPKLARWPNNVFLRATLCWRASRTTRKKRLPEIRIRGGTNGKTDNQSNSPPAPAASASQPERVLPQPSSLRLGFRAKARWMHACELDRVSVQKTRNSRQSSYPVSESNRSRIGSSSVNVFHSRSNDRVSHASETTSRDRPIRSQSRARLPCLGATGGAIPARSFWAHFRQHAGSAASWHYARSDALIV
jgi:hypothetical protein